MAGDFTDLVYLYGKRFWTVHEPTPTGKVKLEQGGEDSTQPHAETNFPTIYRGAGR